jgi:hypothetical protein
LSQKSGNIAIFTAAGALVYKAVRLEPGESVEVLLYTPDGKCTDYVVHSGCCCDINDCAVKLTVHGTLGKLC